MKICMVNQTFMTIDICQASVNCTPIYMGEKLELRLTARGWLHGHSEEGSFVIQKNDNNFDFKVWGNLAVEMFQNSDDVTFKVMMK